MQILVASDVDNPLTGPNGAAAVYGPQKGASPAQVAQLDAALAHWADVVAEVTGADHVNDPGAGAAGGVGFAAVAVLGATLEPGIELLLELIGSAGAAGRRGPGDHRRRIARRAEPGRQGTGRGGRRRPRGRGAR